MTVAPETANGHARGRAVPPEHLEAFTFQGTQRTVYVRKLSTLIRDKTRAVVRRDPAFAEPAPPMVEVDYGDGKVRVPHTGHEVYQQLLREWRARVEKEVSDRLVQLVIRRGVVCEVDADAVAQARADLDAIGVDTRDEDDHYVYVAYVCMGPFDDWTDLLKAVFERTAPAEAAIQAYTAGFPGDVQRDRPVEQPERPAAGEDGLQPGV